jgi:fatty acid desaturase
MDATRLTPIDHQSEAVEKPIPSHYSPELTAFLKRAKSKNVRAIVDTVVWGWGRIALGVAVFAAFPSPLTYIVSILCISSGMGILVALSHESQHSALLRSKKWNDLVGAWLCAYPVGSIYGSSRAVHLAHHKYLNTPQDPDRHFHLEEDKSTPEQFANHFIRLLFGGQLWNSIVVNGFLRHRSASSRAPASELSTNASNIMAAPLSANASNVNASTSAASVDSREDVIFLAKRKTPEVANLLPVQAIVFGTLWLATGYWWAYFALWLVPIFTLGTFFGYLRGFIDHARLEDDDTKLAAGRLISVPHPSLFDRALLTGLDFHFHAEHHFFPAVPHYYLPELHQVLQNDPMFRERYLIRPTYFCFLRDYWKQISSAASNTSR